MRTIVRKGLLRRAFPFLLFGTGLFLSGKSFAREGGAFAVFFAGARVGENLLSDLSGKGPEEDSVCGFSVTDAPAGKNRGRIPDSKPVHRRDTVPDVLFEVSFRRERPQKLTSVEDSIRWDRIEARRAHRDSVKKEDNFWRKMLGGNVDRTYTRKFDLSGAAVPRYSYEGGIGIGALLAASYRLDRADSSLLPSDVALEGNVEWRGFFYVGLSGHTYFPGHRHRFSYEACFEQQNTDFWGITYDACARNPVSSFRRWNVNGKLNYDYQFLPDFYVGAVADLSYSLAKDGTIGAPGYFEGQDTWYCHAGLGLSLQYDSRDFPLYPDRGWNVYVRPMIYPSFMGSSGRTLWKLMLNVNYFQWLWRGAVLAFDLYAENGSRNLPWPMRQMAGGEKRLRGYYLGRYTDNNLFSFQAELRQKLFWRIGIVLFGGFGSVYPSLSELRGDMLLPTYGIGLRFEFKKGLNVRVDYALGKESWRSGIEGENKGVFVLVMAESF